MNNIQNMYPLSPMQKGMLFHSLHAPETEVYTEQFACRFEGRLNYEAFRRAWQGVLDRHEVLRSAFVWEGLEEPLQVVHSEVDLHFEIMDWRDKTAEQKKIDFEIFCAEQRKKGFDFATTPLLKLFIIQLSDDSHFFLWNYHHLLFDGWSLPIILKEVFQLYQAYVSGQEIYLPPVRPYSDYIAWLQNQNLDKAKIFWQDRLQGFSAPTPNYLSKKPNATHLKVRDQRTGYEKLRHIFSKDLSEAIIGLAKQNNLTTNTIFQGVWALLLSHYSSENDVLFGATVSGRPPELPGVETIVGLFINTLPVRIIIDSNQKFLDFLLSLQDQQAPVKQFEFTPLVDIHGWSDVRRDVPLFESLFIFENYPVDQSAKRVGRSMRISELYSIERTNYPLTVVASGGQDSPLGLEMAYETTYYSSSTIERMFLHFESVLTQLTSQPEMKLSGITILSRKERKQILSKWNQTDAPLPDQLIIHQWFEEIAWNNPEKIAVSFSEMVDQSKGEELRLTYSELNSRANQLAHYLQRQGVGVETLVGICLDRSIEMIVSVLAVMKAGGAYVPLDPENPAERLHYMLSDSRIEFLITESRFSEMFIAGKEKIFRSLHMLVYDKTFDVVRKESIENPVSKVTPENLAYVIYTSGSTGRPKGVLLQHRGACNFFAAMIRDFNVMEKHRLLQLSTFGFDGSVAEIFSGLLSGATLHLIQNEILLSINNFVRFLNQNKISNVIIPSSFLNNLPEDQVLHFPYIMSVGDKCSWELAHRWKDHCHFFNGYGPTETTIGAVWGQVRKYIPETLTVPLGRPISNVKIYILDGYLQPVSMGVPGEICIGGLGLARGYLYQSELTAQKFIPDDFSGIPGARLYRTGDLGRFLTDGQIEFLGRIDFQVKIRGFRIELGEIEAVLAKFPGIRQNVVVDFEDTSGVKKLVAYVVADDDSELTPKVLRDYLVERLPEFMIPSAFVFLEQIPLTVSQKVDRKNLPDPQESDLSGVAQFVDPRNHLEELLADIWADILGVQKIGIYSNFFELGGHSLLIMQVVSRIRDVFQIELPLNIMFETENLAALAQHIEKLKSEKDIETDSSAFLARPRPDKMPLSFSQQRLWFIDQLEPGGNNYNIPAAIRLNGALDLDAFKKALQEVTRRHESLRTVFVNDHGTPLQVISEEVSVDIPLNDLSSFLPDEKESKAKAIAREEAISPFNLTSGPLFRVLMIRLKPDEHVAVLTMHHIISDGWSVGILIKEFGQIYKSIIINETIQLPDLPLQYADYAAWQREWLEGERLNKQLKYWKEKLENPPPLLELPWDFPRPAVQTFNGGRESIILPEQLVKALIEKSRAQNATLFMILLAAFNVLLHRYSDEEDIIVGSPIAGRRHSEVEGLIGFFVNNLVLRTKINKKNTFKEILENVRETTLGAYLHQDIPFEKLVEELQPIRDLSHSPLFQVMFVMQNLPVPEFELPDLSISEFNLRGETASYDLSLVIQNAPTGLAVEIEYNTDLFRDVTIKQMLSHYKRLLNAVVEDADQKVEEIPLLSENEIDLLTLKWNETSLEFPDSICVHTWLESIAEEQSDVIAIDYNQYISPDYPDILTYAELNKRANQLAWYLRKLGLQPEQRVGICMERSPDMIIGMLAVLKAGGAFVPMDPDYPAARLQFIIEDSEISFLLIRELLADQFAQSSVNVISLDLDREKIQNYWDANLNLPILPHNLAYVIYTSGSTGKPKGTLLQHQGVCNLATSQKRSFDVGPGNKIMQFSSLSFDASVWEFVMALLSGATLCLTDKEVIVSGQKMVNYMQDVKINTVTLPPSVLAVLPSNDMPALKVLITAGEAVSSQLVEKWALKRRFFNAYGPTETTVCASMHLCEGDYRTNPPIGKPIGNFKLYITAHHSQPVPIGVHGELCVAGVGLARGYINRADLTAEKFTPNPLSREPGARLYRTGDLARYLPDGDIEFIGRIDDQVKLRGFRIEPGEIDALLMKREDISDAVTIVREDIPKDKRLVSYIVSSGESTGDISEIKEFLRKQLPEYMVPSAIMSLDKLPLTSSGKVDRRALPAPEISRDELKTKYVAPRNETEKKLVDITSTLLNIKKVGVNDNFFDLGGHSLLATQFMARVLESFDVEIPLRVLFEKPTVAGIAEEIEKSAKGEAKSTAPVIKRISREAHRQKRSEVS